MASETTRLGTLAAAAAHDFNDELMLIVNELQNLANLLPRDHFARPKLEDMLNAAHRCADITAGLLSFTRTTGVRPQPFPIIRILKECRFQPHE